MAVREFGTCFFEQYAQISLSALLGSEFDGLVNRDRPDLQSEDGCSLGIEVTRAMEESKKAADEMLLDVAGRTRPPRGAEIEQILENGYAYGLQEGKYIGVKELLYWSMALPLMQMPVWFTLSLESLLKNTRSPACRSLMEVMRVQRPFFA